MKCCIVTVYNSQNCGSFLQAYALGKAIESLGHEAFYYKIHNTEKKRMIKTALKSLAKLNFASFSISLQQPKRFQKAISIINETELDDYPTYILGSDTIWDIHTAAFLNNYKTFWGIKFKNAKIIAYAPSIGFSEENDFKNADWLKDALEEMSAISVREKKAKRILQKYTETPIEIVCDPTLLLRKDQFNKIAPKQGMDCIFLYYYGKVPDEFKQAILSKSKKEGIKVVSFGSANSWCDINEPYDPIRFLELYRSARYIITNTFHGTVFSHIYNKKFAMIKSNKPKIYDFLEKMGTLDKVADKPSEIEKVLDSDFDYEKIEMRIEEERKHGFEYLINSLKV